MGEPLALPGHVPLIVATRGDAVESVHHGSIAVADASGRLLWSYGDPAFPVFTRSTLKPFQAMPFVAAGGPEFFGFSEEQVALLCASHSGEPRHVAAVADMLARAGYPEARLSCGCHVPLWYAATGTAPPPGLALSPLQHNCSGKHAGFLAWCRQHGESEERYLDPGHPLQVAIRQSLATLAGIAEGELILGVDGCSAPNYALPLATLATLYARLATAGRTSEPDTPLARLCKAMAGHPEMVSGEGRDDLELMQAAPGEWVAKGGAEGVQALGCMDNGLGIAIKLADGGRRGLRIALAAVLDRLGMLPALHARGAESWLAEEIRNAAGACTGYLWPVIEPGATSETGKNRTQYRLQRP